MLFRKFRQILYNKSNWNDNLQHFLISTRFTKKYVSIDGFWALYRSDIMGMSSLRFVLKESSVMRLWSAWRRSYFVSTVVRRCRRDRGVRDVLQRFRHTLLRPRQTLLLSATAAYKSNRDESDQPPSCKKNITDEELQALLKELENVGELSKKTLFCTSCGKRLVIDRKQPGVNYCSCKESKPSDDSEGWVPYMEADDVIVWRKQYKPGQPYYAYKVYGRYKELRAQDFAAVQVDGAYRRVWDAAVASLSVVERKANGVEDQTVLHWEVLWPRLFANRDYVYIRRHKEFDMERPSSPVSPAPPADDSRPTVHSHAKRKAMEKDLKELEENVLANNKVYIIVSRSCEHSKVPQSKHAIRVADFWSHMVIKTMDGPEKPGMEFVLTYYEEPAVGGLPSGVATWATGRAAPAFLERQRRAAAEYSSWRAHRTHQDLPDYIAFGPETEASLDADAKAAIREQDMESSKQGPDLDTDVKTQDRSTQTDIEQRTTMIATVVAKDDGVATIEINTDKDQLSPASENKTTDANVKLETDSKQNTDILEKCEKDVSSSETKRNEADVKNGGKEPVKSEQKTENGDRETDKTIKKTNGEQKTQDGKEKTKSNEETKTSGNDARNGGQEKQDGDSKQEEKDCEESSNGRWWRWFESFAT